MRPSQEDQKCGLEGVFDVVRIVQELLTDMQDHRPVAVDQKGDSSLGRGVLGDQEPVKQLAIGDVSSHTEFKDRADISQQSRVCRSAGHGGNLPCFLMPHKYSAANPLIIPDFRNGCGNRLSMKPRSLVTTAGFW